MRSYPLSIYAPMQSSEGIKIISVRKLLECPKSKGVVGAQQQSVPRDRLVVEEY